MVLGVIADTHGLLRPAALERLRGCDHIVHAGDIGDPSIVPALEEIAPVTAIRGNVDRADWTRAFPEKAQVEIGGRRVYVLHDRKQIRLRPEAEGIALVISGHSHRARVETIDGVLYLNPGAAGPRRFGLPLSVATVDLAAEPLRAEIHELRG